MSAGGRTGCGLRAFSLGGLVVVASLLTLGCQQAEVGVELRISDTVVAPSDFSCLKLTWRSTDNLASRFGDALTGPEVEMGAALIVGVPRRTEGSFFLQAIESGTGDTYCGFVENIVIRTVPLLTFNLALEDGTTVCETEGLMPIDCAE